jgi:hypothetical protein
LEQIHFEGTSAMGSSPTAQFLLLLFASLTAPTLPTQSSASSSASTGAESILTAPDISASNLFPDRVFYRGKTASAQLRNTAGIHFADGFYFLAGLVDTSGYSTAIAEKYQAYLLTEVPLEFAGQPLKPGAYGAGFVAGTFVVTDLGARDVFQVPAKRDSQIKRPVPLQVTSGSSAGVYRLYRGRDFVEFRRAP